MSSPDDFAARHGLGALPPNGAGEHGEGRPDAAVAAMIDCAAVQAALHTTAALRQLSLHDFLR